ncbi:conserved Plasmodium protein, unknown function [Plasmodium vivax]|uniref:Uncharacterized protein n=6 Tax=Plasmodium vivax TaxID=5855 RepID=A5JZX8_PLAVS|nr:hypothetical protein, conserved [Plasmodium vivax]KMZ78089.1 hypothetical protein PVIIG_00776 [Plasmodium vivax India VII]KMZ84429.1 hypothetical protein PVBG_00209 [Plasmodium vivax Brazil I]KMZ90209.1 hypothetical protein PVMG_01576 [Plasmodium vivax Mauritania I]KMZ96919.1 hypothetical protein PVNG_01743 [Plasmodium vivax North Korean]EDL47539.1 hypothetical protein, conserved [Plasmodium vivax]|eukprot:XP_001617266.1 hypothetical protein [Plasmodium vivax Sal-1]
MLKSCFENLVRFSHQCVRHCCKNKNEVLLIKKFSFATNGACMGPHRGSILRGFYFPFLKSHLNFILKKQISTKRRRYFKIRKHQKKKYKKKRMGLSTIPWIPTKEKVRTYKLPRQSRLINKRFMRDKKGGRRYRLKKQR